MLQSQSFHNRCNASNVQHNWFYSPTILMPRLLPGSRTSSTVRAGPQAWFPAAGDPSDARDFCLGDICWTVDSWTGTTSAGEEGAGDGEDGGLTADRVLLGEDDNVALKNKEIFTPKLFSNLSYKINLVLQRRFQSWSRPPESRMQTCTWPTW